MKTAFQNVMLASVILVMASGILLAAERERPNVLIVNELTGSNRPALPELANLRCFTNEYGWIYAPDEKDAYNLYEAEQEAALLFRKHFGSPPEKGVYFTMLGDFKEPTGFIENLRKMEARWLMPHVGHEQITALVDGKEMREQLRNQLRAQLGLKPPNWLAKLLITAMRKSIIQQIEQEVSKNTIAAHELGHVWFVAKYWPDFLLSLNVTEQQYGGPAADWLDEAAAILMEDGTLSASRRTYFADALTNKSDLFIPLERLFSMRHPGNKGGQTTAGFIGVVVTVNSSSGTSDSQDKEAKPDMFYAEIRTLADFMFERSNNDTLFASIAEAERDGKGMTGWLKEKGPANKLPATVAELEKEFIAWSSVRRAE